MTEDQKRTDADDLLRDLLQASLVYLDRVMDPEHKMDTALFAATALTATYAGAAAYLLDAFNTPPMSADDHAETLREWLDGGEPLADWVFEKAQALGVELPAPTP